MSLLWLTLYYFFGICVFRLTITIGIIMIPVIIIAAILDFYHDYWMAKRGFPSRKPIDIFM